MIVTGKVPIFREVTEQWRQLSLVLFISLAVVELNVILGERWVKIDVTPLTALGVALGIFLSFRNTMVYNRYWEARTLLGRLVNASRTFPRQMTTLVSGGSAEERESLQRDMAMRLLAFVKSVRAHLRDEPTGAHLPEYHSPEELAEIAIAHNIPSRLLQMMGNQLRIAHRRGLISDFHITRLDDTLTEFTDILGGCERIKNTPLPPAYTYLAHKIMLVYCCLLPFGLVAGLGIVTPAVAFVISFAFLTLDRVSDLIEQPFDTMENDLPLNAIARNIEIEILQHLGETDLPKPLEPVNGILL